MLPRGAGSAVVPQWTCHLTVCYRLVMLTKRHDARGEVEQPTSMFEDSLPDTAPITVGKSAMPLILAALTDMYADPVQATVRETISNALDASVAAGTDRPVEVHTPTEEDLMFTVRDHGTGMSPAVVDTAFAGYASSTKIDDLSQIGAKGCGAKAPLSYTTTFRVDTVQAGVHTSCVIDRSEGTLSRTLTSRPATGDETTGTVVSVPVRPNDVEPFDEAVGYYRSCPLAPNLVVDGQRLSGNGTLLYLSSIVVDEDTDTKADVWADPGWVLSMMSDTTTSGSKERPDIGYVIGGWTYGLGDDAHVNHSQYHHKTLPGQYGKATFDVLVSLPPGVVDFTSSRDHIVVNTSSQKLSRILRQAVTVELSERVKAGLRASTDHQVALSVAALPHSVPDLEWNVGESGCSWNDQDRLVGPGILTCEDLDGADGYNPFVDMQAHLNRDDPHPWAFGFVLISDDGRGRCSLAATSRTTVHSLRSRALPSWRDTTVTTSEVRDLLSATVRGGTEIRPDIVGAAYTVRMSPPEANLWEHFDRTCPVPDTERRRSTCLVITGISSTSDVKTVSARAISAVWRESGGSGNGPVLLTSAETVSDGELSEVAAVLGVRDTQSILVLSVGTVSDMWMQNRASRRSAPVQSDSVSTCTVEGFGSEKDFVDGTLHMGMGKRLGDGKRQRMFLDRFDPADADVPVLVISGKGTRFSSFSTDKILTEKLYGLYTARPDLYGHQIVFVDSPKESGLKGLNPAMPVVWMDECFNRAARSLSGLTATYAPRQVMGMWLTGIPKECVIAMRVLLPIIKCEGSISYRDNFYERVSHVVDAGNRVGVDTPGADIVTSLHTMVYGYFSEGHRLMSFEDSIKSERIWNIIIDASVEDVSGRVGPKSGGAILRWEKGFVDSVEKQPYRSSESNILLSIARRCTEGSTDDQHPFSDMFLSAAIPEADSLYCPYGLEDVLGECAQLALNTDR